MKNNNKFETLHLYDGVTKNKSNIQTLFEQEFMSKHSLSDTISTNLFICAKVRMV